MRIIKSKSILAAGAALVFTLGFWACKDDFLNVSPTGQLTNEVLSSKKGIEGVLIGAYSMLGGRGNFFSGASNWLNGSILGGEANKGTNGGDQAVVNPVQRYETLPNNGVVAEKWRICFEGVARCNTLLRLTNATTDPTVTAADKTRLAAEARFLRGFYYFELRRAFGSVPYVDESMTSDEAIKVPNNVDIYPKIEADFQFAADNLPETQSALGRANKWAA